MSKELNINRRIRASYVRVIGKDGEQLGILDTRQAVQLAESLSLDLVEVAGTADPPVCKIMDYGKYKYQEKKKAQAAKKKQVVVELKEIQIRPKTDVHDLEHKAKSVLGFLDDANKAKITVVYRGRELEHLDQGWDTLVEFVEKLGDMAQLETQPRFEGRRMFCIFAPLGSSKKPVVGSLVASLVKPPSIARKMAQKAAAAEAAAAAAGTQSGASSNS